MEQLRNSTEVPWCESLELACFHVTGSYGKRTDRNQHGTSHRGQRHGGCSLVTSAEVKGRSGSQLFKVEKKKKKYYTDFLNCWFLLEGLRSRLWSDVKDSRSPQMSNLFWDKVRMAIPFFHFFHSLFLNICRSANVNQVLSGHDTETIVFPVYCSCARCFEAHSLAGGHMVRWVPRTWHTLLGLGEDERRAPHSFQRVWNQHMLFSCFGGLDEPGRYLIPPSLYLSNTPLISIYLSPSFHATLPPTPHRLPPDVLISAPC